MSYSLPHQPMSAAAVVVVAVLVVAAMEDSVAMDWVPEASSAFYSHSVELHSSQLVIVHLTEPVSVGPPSLRAGVPPVVVQSEPVEQPPIVLSCLLVGVEEITGTEAPDFQPPVYTITRAAAIAVVSGCSLAA